MIDAQRVRLRSFVVNDRTKLNTIIKLAKRAKSALCKQNERKTKKKASKHLVYMWKTPYICLESIRKK